MRSILKPSPILLLVFAAVIVLQRLHTYTEPIERDIAGYAVIAHEMLHGRQLYSDLWERKPPLIYGVFAAAEMIAGYGRAEIFLLNITTAIATMLGLYFAGKWFRPASSDQRTGLIAAALWTIVGGDLYLQANQPNTEAFLNTCLIWAIAILFHMTGNQRCIRWLASLCVGVLFAAATLIKHHTIAACGLLIFGYTLTPFLRYPLAPSRLRGRLNSGIKSSQETQISPATNEPPDSLPKVTSDSPYLRTAAEMAIATATIVIAWAGVIGYFAMVGRLNAFIDVLFRQNLDYVGYFWQSALNIAQPFAGQGRFIRWAIAPAGMMFLWLMLMFARRIRPVITPQLLILFTGAIGIWLVISTPGHFFPHYYQVAIPIVCLAAAGAASGLSDPRLRVSPHAGRLAIGLMFTVCLIRQSRFYLLSPDQWSVLKDVGNFIEQDRLADHLKSMLEPNERFWNFGQDTTLYFATQKSPPTGLIYLDPLKPGVGAAKYWRQLMHDLKSNPPNLIVISRSQYWSVGLDAPVFPWLHVNYLTLGVDPAYPSYLLMVRLNGDLKKRTEGQ